MLPTVNAGTTTSLQPVEESSNEGGSLLPWRECLSQHVCTVEVCIDIGSPPLIARTALSNEVVEEAVHLLFDH